MVQFILKYNSTYKCYTILKRGYSLFLIFNSNLYFNFKIVKQFLQQLQAMFICYPTIYDMTMLAIVSYMKTLIEWKHPVYPDSILNKQRMVHGSQQVLVYTPYRLGTYYTAIPILY
jgi:hypothetical protein